MRASAFGARAHAGQVRKFTGEPYFNHCLDVACRVMAWGGSNDQVIAALLHDVVEDCRVYWDEIEREVGPEVAQIVYACTDTPALKGYDRRTQKLIFLESLPLDHPAILVMLGDTISNIADCVTTLENGGVTAFSEFSAGLGIIKYYDAKIAALSFSYFNAYQRQRDAYQVHRDRINELLTPEQSRQARHSTLWDDTQLRRFYY